MADHLKPFSDLIIFESKRLNQNVRRNPDIIQQDVFVAFLGRNMNKSFCCPALELFHYLPLWKTVLFVSSRAFSLSAPTFLLSIPVDNSEATWKKATKCSKDSLHSYLKITRLVRFSNKIIFD